MTQHTVSSSALNGAAPLIRSYGEDPDLLARLAGLDLISLDQPSTKLPLDRVLRFLEMGATACNEPQFGIELARRQGLEVLGLVWILARHAETVGGSLDSIGQALDLHSTALSLQARPERDGVLLDYDIQADDEHSVLHAVEQSFALLCNEIRVVAGHRWQPRYVQFRHGQPANMEKHQAMFGRELHFNQARNALLLDAPTLALRINNDPRAHRIIRQHLRVQQHISGESFTTRVAQVIRNLLNSDDCSAQQVADVLGLRLRTLQHRLTAAGSSYQALRDEVRLNLCQRYLRDSTLSISEIADLLHFSETSSFSRFFRKHAGETAGEYQRRHRNTATK